MAVEKVCPHTDKQSITYTIIYAPAQELKI